MSEEREPYECMNEADPHAATDYITRLLAGLLLALIVMIASACPAKAEGRNWCADWRDGYRTGYCWSNLRCEFVPDVTCPDAKDGQLDGYMAGLNAGLSDGKVTL